MASYCRTIILGNLVRDPELKHLANGTSVCDLSIAVNSSYKDKAGNKVDEVSYFDVTFFGRIGEVCSEYLKTGSSLLVDGRLKQERWEKDGQKRSKVKIIGESMQMLGDAKGGGKPSSSKGGRQSSNEPSGSSSEYNDAPAAGGDDVPF